MGKRGPMPGTHPKEKTKRNHTIVRLVRRGWRYEAVATRYKLTKQRVAQIVKRYQLEVTETNE